MNVDIPIPPAKRHHLDAQASALLQQLVSAPTPAAVDAWMTTNVVTLAQARSVLTALALAVRYLYLNK